GIELVFSAAVLLFLALLSLAVVRLGLSPLEHIAETAGDIAGGDLSRRVEPAESDTEIGRLGLALNAMLAQIETAFAERAASEDRLRRFVADASHELRTPLTAIRGYAELFRRGAADRPEDLARAMRRIEDEAARMGLLVDDLLLLARLDQGRPVDCRCHRHRPRRHRPRRLSPQRPRRLLPRRPPDRSPAAARAFAHAARRDVGAARRAPVRRLIRARGHPRRGPSGNRTPG